MRNRHGIAMVVIMMSLGLLAVTVAAITFLSNRSQMQSKLQAETDEAFFAAQAALSLKVAELKSGDENPKDGRMTESDAHYDVSVYLAGDSVTELSGFTVPVDHYYIVAKGYDRDPAVSGVKPREVMFGALFKKSATVFTAAALAGDTLLLDGNGYTDTWDASGGNDALAHVGVYNPGGDVTVASGSYVGKDGLGNALADILLPTGGGSVTAASGSFAAQTVSPFLTAPDPVPPRTSGTNDKVIESDTEEPPDFISGEYVIKAKDFKVSGAVYTLDVSALPDGEPSR